MQENRKLKKVASYYDKRAKNSDAVRAAGQWGSKELVPQICKEICKKINVKKDYNVLEIGCGSGVLGNVIKDLCAFYVGIDISFEMIKKFKNLSQTKLSLCQGITDALPFTDKFFDLVIMNSVTMYFHQPNQLQKTLIEIERIANKDAIIFIGDNVVPSGALWELSWFQNLNPLEQNLAKPYVRMRKWLSHKNSKFAGKWADLHAEVSPEFIQKYFEGKGEVIISESAASFVKNKIMEKKRKSSKRMDFVIKLR